MDKSLYLALLKKYLSQKRIEHSIGVAETSEKLAVKFGCQPDKAYMAGLLHDIARELPPKEILAILRKSNYSFYEEDFLATQVLHGYAAAIILRQELNINDQELLQAIERHTTGDKEMSTLDAIIFIADMVEPGRSYPGVDQIRAALEQDLYDALLLGIKHTITYLLKNNWIVHPRSITTYNWLISNKK